MKSRHSPAKNWQVVGVIAICILCQAACNLVSHRGMKPTQPTYTAQVKFTARDRDIKATPFLISTLTATLIPGTPTPEPPMTASPTAHPSATSTKRPPTSTAPKSYSEYLVIGWSVLGNPLEVYRFGNGPTRRIIVAGIHGGAELNTIQLADELIEYLHENPKLVPPDMTLYILRSLNPDGEIRTSGPEGRANQNGVDLNRNWDAFWQAEPDLSGCWALYVLSSGDVPHSEPETQSLAKFLSGMEIDALISYHSAGQGIYAGGQPPDPDSIRLAKRLSEVSGYLYPPIDAGCVYTGQLIDWAVEHGITAVDIELPNKWETQFDINAQIMETFLRWEK